MMEVAIHETPIEAIQVRLDGPLKERAKAPAYEIEVGPRPEEFFPMLGRLATTGDELGVVRADASLELGAERQEGPTSTWRDVLRRAAFGNEQYVTYRSLEDAMRLLAAGWNAHHALFQLFPSVTSMEPHWSTMGRGDVLALLAQSRYLIACAEDGDFAHVVPLASDPTEVRRAVRDAAEKSAVFIQSE